MGTSIPEADPEQIVDLLAAPPFVRALPVGLPPFSERYAEELLETIWRGIAPLAPRALSPARTLG